MVNGDPDGQIGNVVETALLASDHEGNPDRLHWISKPRWRYPTDESIKKALKKDGSAWLIVQVIDNATQALVTAERTGNTDWRPHDVIQVWYASARNYVAMDSYVVVPAKVVLIDTMNELNINISSTWFQAAYTAALNNTTTLATMLNYGMQAPQTIGHAVDFTENDVNMFDEPITVASTYVGLIYSLLLAFNITMALFGARQPILPFLRRSHLLILRIVLPLITYLLVSFVFSMINLPFHARFSNLGRNTAEGFSAFFAVMFTGMTVFGLSTEIALELLSPKFVAVGLMFLVILNVSGANYPIPMMNAFYRISYAMPFYNLRQAFIKILYDQGTSVQLFINWLILAAWVVVLLAILPLYIIRDQRKAIAMRKAAAAGGGPGTGPEGTSPGPPSTSSHTAPPSVVPSTSSTLTANGPIASPRPTPQKFKGKA